VSDLIKIEKMNESVGDLLRFWRQLHKISQMDLALDVGVSTKHLSFVETGKSRPSRNLVLKIAQALKLPLRHRNTFLMAAGYASEFGEAPFDGQKMEIVRQALHRMIEKHEPYPAFVINTGYRILMKNSGFDQIVKLFAGEHALKTYDNVYRLLFAEDGLRPYVKDWSTIEHFLVGRLWEEAASTQNGDLIDLYHHISQLRTGQAPVGLHVDTDLPILSLTLEKQSVKASFFSTVTTLGTPLDLTTQEIRIESLFPADEKTKQMFPIQN